MRIQPTTKKSLIKFFNSRAGEIVNGYEFQDELQGLYEDVKKNHYEMLSASPKALVEKCFDQKTMKSLCSNPASRLHRYVDIVSYMGGEHYDGRFFCRLTEKNDKPLSLLEGMSIKKAFVNCLKRQKKEDNEMLVSVSDWMSQKTTLIEIC